MFSAVNEIVQFILGLGASVMLPIIIFIFGLILGRSPAERLNLVLPSVLVLSGLTS